MTLNELNARSQEKAEQELLRCCGSREWAKRMAAARPFANPTTLREQAERMWWKVGEADWLEAFRAHPRIGERVSASEPGSGSGNGWAAQEQAQVNSADNSTVAGLARANEQYFAKFGYIFIVCATGKSGEEMLGMLRSRLPNDPGRELRVAAAEQSKITLLRLDKLVTA